MCKTAVNTRQRLAAARRTPLLPPGLAVSRRIPRRTAPHNTPSPLQRAAGYAAIELAQAVQQLLAERRRGAGLWVNSEGSSGQGGCSGRHLFGWRDAVDIVVK